ncbi:MAG: VWA domain-containing protein [Myxococcales bacterium]|nr:VWA domain-containing protein [Myxococcales bacterium]
MNHQRFNLGEIGWAVVPFVVAASVACSDDPMRVRQHNASYMGPPPTFEESGGAGAEGTGGPGSGGFDNAAPVSGPAPQINTGVMAPDECLKPTVLFVIDGSGSMCAPFGASTRWTELRNVLLDEQSGLVTVLQSRGAFGMLLYDGSIDVGLVGQSTASGPPAPDCANGLRGGFGRRGMGEQGCMQVVDVPAAIANYTAIANAFPSQQLGGSTPTDRAMNQAVDSLIASLEGQDLEQNPPYIILATDGQPNDVCVGGAGGDGSAQQAGVVEAVERAWMNGITTFVISLADDAGLQAHLQEVATAGQPGNPAAAPFSPQNPDDLQMTLTSLLATAFGCDLQ